MANISPQSVWYAHSPAVAPLIIALRKGWLEGTLAREGISLQSVDGHADPAVRRSYSDHHLSFQIRQGGNVPAIWARSSLALGADLSTGIGLTLEAEELKTFARYKQFLLDWKFIDNDFSLDDWVAPAHLAAGAARGKTGTH